MEKAIIEGRSAEREMPGRGESLRGRANGPLSADPWIIPTHPCESLRTSSCKKVPSLLPTFPEILPPNCLCLETVRGERRPRVRPPPPPPPHTPTHSRPFARGVGGRRQASGQVSRASQQPRPGPAPTAPGPAHRARPRPPPLPGPRISAAAPAGLGPPGTRRSGLCGRRGSAWPSHGPEGGSRIPAQGQSCEGPLKRSGPRSPGWAVGGWTCPALPLPFPARPQGCGWTGTPVGCLVSSRDPQ